jgi:acetolactate synthase-1/2/3 large subunit
VSLRLADYVMQSLARHGIRHVFMVTGGGAMHLNDAIGRCKDLEYICCHHEQACAMAAASYYRLTNRLAAVNVTTGPGGTNAITGVFGAWVESLGTIVISGQVRFETTVRSTCLPLRQLGDQELDITRLVAPITKYAVMVTDPATIRFHMEKALHLATEGRPGPVWLDIPMNVQSAQIDPASLEGFAPEAARSEPERITSLAPAIDRILNRLSKAERPVILAGSGIRLAGAEKEFLDLVERLGIPVVTGFNAHDLIGQGHPCYVGRQGTIGDRAGNFAVQNSDLLIVVGCRLTIRQLSYNWENFARSAYKVMVDVDPAELEKPTIKIDLPIRADARDFLRTILLAIGPPLPAGEAGQAPAGPGEGNPGLPSPASLHSATSPAGRGEGRAANSAWLSLPARFASWLAWCLERKDRYPVVLPEYWKNDSKGINPYCFIHSLFERLPSDAIVVTGDGTACITTFQAAALKPGQRLYSDGGNAPMGFDLPGAIGAAVGSGRKPVICLAGDGSIQMNIQELQTIATNRLPITIFVLNNDGYLSIRLTQQNFFPDNPVGTDPRSGVGTPDFEKIAAAYGFPYAALRKHADLSPSPLAGEGRGEGGSTLGSLLAAPGPQIIEVFLDPTQPFAPKTSSRRLPDGRMISAPLEDMFPFLDREEFARNMNFSIRDSAS